MVQYGLSDVISLYALLKAFTPAESLDGCGNMVGGPEHPVDVKAESPREPGTGEDEGDKRRKDLPQGIEHQCGNGGDHGHQGTAAKENQL